ncbi:hypothetical protein TRSC58_07599 [Trypanosoma rangeli SC58]|uniref:Uncharacterized protein n=1 Tax=Trypanosoma rangeli SC58 TaxID=429131 RepID=A0A061ISV1_TRYRA|nr:hypothetical protein TRSC58_07599 [Trypanosoma rangeli SC58]
MSYLVFFPIPVCSGSCAAFFSTTLPVLVPTAGGYCSVGFCCFCWLRCAAVGGTFRFIFFFIILLLLCGHFLFFLLKGKIKRKKRCPFSFSLSPSV